MAKLSYAVQQRTYSDGRSKDHKQSLLSWVVAVVTMFMYTGWMHVLLGLMVGSFFSRTCLYILLAVWATKYLPAKPLLWGAFCRSWVFRTWREYFNYSFLMEEELETEKTYIFVETPHGVFPLCPLVAGTNCQVVWPHWPIYSLAASSVYGIPWWRHFIAWIGAVPATSGNFKKMLKKGHSVAVIVGGIAEMYMQHPRKERIKLLDRKGFVKVAIEQGITGGIIPVYNFGNTQIFDWWPESAAGLARKYRAALGFLVGRWSLPVPRQVPLFQVCGAPIPVPHIDPAADPEAFKIAVDEVHAQVVTAMQELYDRYKVNYGWENRPLVIE